MTYTLSVALQISVVLRGGRFDLDNEKDCQQQMHDWLTERLPWPVQREVRISPRDIPDFLIERVAVEVKLNRQRPADVMRQLARYAAHSGIDALVLVSNRAMNLPSTIGGKPVFGVSLGEAWL